MEISKVSAIIILYIGVFNRTRGHRDTEIQMLLGKSTCCGQLPEQTPPTPPASSEVAGEETHSLGVPAAP